MILNVLHYGICSAKLSLLAVLMVIIFRPPSVLMTMLKVNNYQFNKQIDTKYMNINVKICIN